MYIFDKSIMVAHKPPIRLPAFKGSRRLSASKKITKSNKEFLRSLGFKLNIKNAANIRPALSRQFY
jgi:hypothetical protein